MNDRSYNGETYPHIPAPDSETRMQGGRTPLNDRAPRRGGRLAALVHGSRGSVSTMVGFILLLVVGATGGAIDISNAMRQRVLAQHDLDAALLATFRDADSMKMTAAQREGMIRSFLTQTFTDFPADAGITVSRNGDTYSATLDFSSKSNVLQIVGIDRIPLGVASSVTTAAPPPLELALVLDTTNSMAQGDKLDTMKAAARDLATTLSQFDTVRIALVPFAQYINIGMENRNAAGLDIPADRPDSETCKSTPDVTYSNCRKETTTCTPRTCTTYMGRCTSDGVTSSCPKKECARSPRQCEKEVCDETPTGTHTTSCKAVSGPKWRGCVGSREYPANTRDTMVGGPVPGFLDGSCAQPVIRLTGDRDAILDAIDGFSTAGETYIAPALLWGKRMIGTGTPFPDGSTDPGVRKVIVLMSDGVNTISKPGGTMMHDGTDRDASDAVTREVCDNIKAQGVTVVTVAYDIDDPAGRELLKDCASPGRGMFFDARTDAQLADSFESIGRGFQSVRIAR